MNKLVAHPSSIDGTDDLIIKSFVLSKLVDRVRNIQKNAVGGDGANQCGKKRSNFQRLQLKIILVISFIQFSAVITPACSSPGL
jgi:hypothetical protein